VANSFHRASASQTDLLTELALWRAAGLKARFWWRDDDASAASPQLRRLLDLADELRLDLAIAVVPAKADRALAQLLDRSNCSIWQHGLHHRDFGDGEFGAGRSLEARVRDALQGQRAMDALFGAAGWQHVFVPPFHLWSLDFKMLTPLLGYEGVSSGNPTTPRVQGVAELNAEIDVVDWATSEFAGGAAVNRLLLEELHARRTGMVAAESPIGFLTHHAVFDEDAWHFLATLFRLLRDHPASEWLAPDRAFAQGCNTTPGDEQAAPADVTVVITSCGRQDLLERTIDTFLKFNTFPVARVLIVEDGDGSGNARLERKYAGLGFEWLATRHRVGQIAAIDAAYRLVKTKYIFHCEDDWEFIEAGFIEKSLAVLQSNERILQVALRALDDIHGHPLLAQPFAAAGVSYRLFKHSYDAPDGRTWHGFSFNPGLRRTADYLCLGTYGALDPLGEQRSEQVESEISRRYRERGMFAAILDEPAGYVRHLGAGRSVPLPRGPATAPSEPVHASKAPARMGFGQHCRDLVPSLVRAIEARIAPLRRTRSQE
jgi:hypothetical protein